MIGRASSAAPPTAEASANPGNSGRLRRPIGGRASVVFVIGLVIRKLWNEPL